DQQIVACLIINRHTWKDRFEYGVTNRTLTSNDTVRIGCRGEQVAKTVGSTGTGSDLVACNTQFTTDCQAVGNIKFEGTESSKVGCFLRFPNRIITVFCKLATISSAFGRIVKEETTDFRTNTLVLR